MSESVSLPALGESVTEGTVTRWLKNVGDRVEVDEPLVEVSTDKVDTEIPSPIAGVIEEILVAEDETVEVGTALVRIGDGAPVEGGGETAAPEPESAQPEVSEQSASEPDSTEPEAAQEPAPSTPTDVAAAPADEAPVPEVPSADAPTESADSSGDNGTDHEPSSQGAATETPSEKPTDAQPTAAPQSSTPTENVEPDGAKSDDEKAKGEKPEDEKAAPTPDAHAGYVTPLVRKLANDRGVDLDSLTGTGVGGRIRKQDVLDAADARTVAEPESTPVAPRATEVSALRGTTIPMSRLRKVIAERAVVSMQSSAQLTSVVEVDVTLIAKLRTRVKNDFQAKTGQKLSFLPFFALAATQALAQYPIVNATIEGDSIVYPAQENIAIAVDTERGLLTPVIRNASELDLAGFAGQIADLASRTRDNKLKPDELAGGTFTLTNTGSRGALFDTPIVFLPQVAILGTGIVAKRPVVVSDESGDAIAIRSMVYLALSYDHRIVDGADAARFLVAVKDRLESGDFEGQLGI